MSMGSGIYRRWAPSAFAVRWNPGETGEAFALLNSLHSEGVRYLQPEHDAWLFVITPHRRYVVYPNDWLVLEDGDLTCVTPRVFEATYEEIQ